MIFMFTLTYVVLLYKLYSITIFMTCKVKINGNIKFF